MTTHPRTGRAAPAAAEQLGERLGFLLKHAHGDYQAIQRPLLEPLELDGRLLAVLMLVEASGPALQQRLAEHLAVDRTTMVALVDALERAGMVARRHDPADRRGRRVTLTRAGADALRAAHDAVASVEEEFLAPLTEAEQRQFRRLLAKLVLARA